MNRSYHCHCPDNIRYNLILDCCCAYSIDLFYIRQRGFKYYISLTHSDCLFIYGVRKVQRFMRRLVCNR